MTPKTILTALLLVFFTSSLLGREPANRRGTIFCLDGLPASGKSSLAVKLATSPSILLSTDDLAAEAGITYYQAARRVLRQAVELASTGKQVVLDSFLIEDFFELKKSEKYDIKLIGLWCPLSCLKSRFDGRAGVPNAHLRTNLIAEYESRYENREAEDIEKTKGAFMIEKNSVSFNYFFNTEKWSTAAMVLDLKSLL